MNGELVFARAGFGASAVPYLDGWDLQRALHERRVGGEIPDTCLMLEHQPVYTAGRRTSPLDRPLANPGIPVIDVDRGGKITWHGPGQLVGYPIFRLEGGERDLHLYLRNLEEAIIRALARFDLPAARKPDWTGVWTPDGARKLASIGVAVKRWVTMHGFALNVATDLARFTAINPCGLDAAVMGSMAGELGRPPEMAAVKDAVQATVADVFGRRL